MPRPLPTLLPDAARAEQALCAEDAALPGLRLLLDEQALQARLQALGPDAPPLRLEWTYLRYKRGTNAVAGLRLHGDGAPTDLSLRALPRARFEQTRTKPRYRNPIPLAADSLQAPRAWDDTSLLLHGPAYDPELPGLRRLLDPARQQRWLQRLLGATPESSAHQVAAAARAEVRTAQLQTLRYKPGRRWVASVRSTTGSPLAVLRVVDADDHPGAAAGALFGARHGGPLLRGAVPDHCAFASAWVPGVPLAAYGDALPPPASLRRLGRRLARLHLSPQRPQRQRQRSDELAALWAATQGLADVLPALGPAAHRVAERVAAALAAAPPWPAALHGDFAPDQVVLDATDPRHFTFIDWDQAASGDAAADLGNFIARLGYHALAGDGDRATAAASAAGLLDGHAGRLGQVPAALPAQTATALLRLACEGFRRRHRDWPALAHALLGTAEDLLQGGSWLLPSGRRLGVPVPVPAPRSAATSSLRDAGADGAGIAGPIVAAAVACDDAEMAAAAAADAAHWPALATALDPAALQPLLARGLGVPAHSLRLTDVALWRHKPGRRALLACTVEHPDAQPGGHAARPPCERPCERPGEPVVKHADQPVPMPPHAPAAAGAPALVPVREELLAKLRAKGLDRRAPDVQGALWRAGFAAEQGAAVAVPAVLGSVPELGLWLQRRMPGRPLTAWLDRPVAPQTLDLLARTGRALAALHASPQPVDRCWTADDELAGLRRRFAAMVADRPALAGRLAALQRDCETLGAQLAQQPGAGCASGIHRDFYPCQVLVDGERLVLLDFDLYAIGPPALDVGNFVAHLVEHAVRRLGDAAALDAGAQAFRAAYLAAAPAVSAEAVEGWTTLGLARHVDLSRHFPARRHTTEAVLALCEQRLHAARADVAPDVASEAVPHAAPDAASDRRPMAAARAEARPAHGAGDKAALHASRGSPAGLATT
jgi:Ser/Thr protein kinase RdoA (MazF antagonist)